MVERIVLRLALLIWSFIVISDAASARQQPSIACEQAGDLEERIHLLQVVMDFSNGTTNTTIEVNDQEFQQLDLTDHARVEAAMQAGLFFAARPANAADQCQEGERYFQCDRIGPSTDSFDYCANRDTLSKCPVNGVHPKPCCSCGGCLASTSATNRSLDMWFGPYDSSIQSEPLNKTATSNLNDCKMSCKDDSRCKAIMHSEKSTFHERNCFMYDELIDNPTWSKPKGFLVYKLVRHKE
eukprot:TRINITY_DN14300_c0_g1_i1.p1 TRINITY_DN14300_c0_g1~~TRINITY_DN14300_c0_g1_i1.p1  ORF type:complete len:240 (-),score=30.09 TRINITY_DN14300_c0_g1_i1:397-1116(-)